MREFIVIVIYLWGILELRVFVEFKEGEFEERRM